MSIYTDTIIESKDIINTLSRLIFHAKRKPNIISEILLVFDKDHVIALVWKMAEWECIKYSPNRKPYSTHYTTSQLINIVTEQRSKYKHIQYLQLTENVMTHTKANTIVKVYKNIGWSLP